MKISIIYHSQTGNVKAMAKLIQEGCLKVPDTQAQCFTIDNIDEAWVVASQAIIFGSPTYEGTCSWQMKKYFDTQPIGLANKLGAVFASQNWPGGGGADLAEMTMIAAMLVHGMLIYSGGIAQGAPYLHFGAVSTRNPDQAPIFVDRCVKLGKNIARKAHELFD